MDVLLKLLTDYKIIDFIIVGVGVFGIALVVDRYKKLYKEYALPAEDFIQKIVQMIESDRVEEAITLCGAHDKKPMAYVTKRILERSDRDDDAIEQSYNVATSEVAPRLMKGLGHLAMVSNVITLIGLLGTVVGLIAAFQAVSVADVAMKQTLLAEGISIAMSATALGLLFAIPIMFCYSFLHAKQMKLFSEVDECAQKVLESLRGRIFVSYHANARGTNGPAPIRAS